MKFTTGRQFGLGNREYTLTEGFSFFSRELPKGLTVDGSSVPKVLIMFVSSILLLFFPIPSWLQPVIIISMLLVGISESSGWFMKPAAVHDYRFQNANTLYGWIPANFEYWLLMMLKINEYRKDNPNNEGFIMIAFHSIMGSFIALIHFIVLMFFGWFVWGSYYYKNNRDNGA